jgi:MarR family transcriptional regulator, transcriptional regulator for hemolysin
VTVAEPEPITFLVLDAARLIRQRFERELETAGLGITAGEARTLLWAGRHPGLRQAALAEKLGVEPMTLVGFLDRLEAAGFVTRTQDPTDRRAKLVQPTDAATPLVARIESIALTVRERAMGALGERQSEMIRAGLEQMRDALSASGAVGT